MEIVDEEEHIAEPPAAGVLKGVDIGGSVRFAGEGRRGEDAVLVLEFRRRPVGAVGGGNGQEKNQG